MRPPVQPTQSKDLPYWYSGHVCSTTSYNNDMWLFKGKGITAGSDWEKVITMISNEKSIGIILGPPGRYVV